MFFFLSFSLSRRFFRFTRASVRGKDVELIESVAFSLLLFDGCEVLVFS